MHGIISRQTLQLLLLHLLLLATLCSSFQTMPPEKYTLTSPQLSHQDNSRTQTRGTLFRGLRRQGISIEGLSSPPDFDRTEDQIVVDALRSRIAKLETWAADSWDEGTLQFLLPPTSFPVAESANGTIPPPTEDTYSYKANLLDTQLYQTPASVDEVPALAVDGQGNPVYLDAKQRRMLREKYFF